MRFDEFWEEIDGVLVSYFGEKDEIAVPGWSGCYRVCSLVE